MKKHSLCAAALLAGAGLASSALAQSVWYVDDSAVAPGNGAAWASAFTDLQSALAAAAPGDEIRVAQGLYLPTTTGARAASFVLRNGATMSGGYAGVGAADPDERDLAAYATVLSGDLAGDDGSAFANRADNSHHVVSVFAGTPATVLDGFTVRSGNADTSSSRIGGGMYIDSGSPTIRNCLFTDNKANDPFGGGAGVFAYSGVPTFDSCTFAANNAQFPFSIAHGFGGGMYAEAASIIDCAFIGNTANEGGGLFIENNTTITGTLFASNQAPMGGAINRGGTATGLIAISDCEFSDNSATQGGAIRLSSHLSPFSVRNSTFFGNSAVGLNGLGGAILNLGTASTVERSIFAGNSATNSGGAMGTTGDPVILNCTVANNTAGNIGGGICQTASNSAPRIRNTILWENSDSSGPFEQAQVGAFFTDAPPAFIDYSCVMDLAPMRAGAGNISTDPLFTNEANRDFSLLAPSPCINAGDPALIYNDPDGSRNDIGAVVVQNASPVASASCQQLTSIGDTATVRLDGAASSDPDGLAEDLSFEWFVDGVSVCAGDDLSCGVIQVPMTFGVHSIVLRVTDSGNAFDEDAKSITVDPASLSLLETGLVSVHFTQSPTPGTVRYQGQIGLPAGVDYSEVTPQISMTMVLADTEIVSAASLALTRGSSPSNENEWTYNDPSASNGVRRMSIDWSGAEFSYSPRQFPVSMQSSSITSSQSTLTLRFRSRQMGAFTLNIGGGQAIVSVDAIGNVTSSVPSTVERRGRDVTLNLPFPIVATTSFVFTGGADRTVVAADSLTNSLGRFSIDAQFDPALFPSRAATTPRTLELGLTVGAQGYPGQTSIGASRLLVVARRWLGF